MHGHGYQGPLLLRIQGAACAQQGQGGCAIVSQGWLWTLCWRAGMAAGVTLQYSNMWSVFAMRLAPPVSSTSAVAIQRQHRAADQSLDSCQYQGATTTTAVGVNQHRIAIIALGSSHPTDWRWQLAYDCLGEVQCITGATEPHSFSCALLLAGLGSLHSLCLQHHAVEPCLWSWAHVLL